VAGHRGILAPLPGPDRHSPKPKCVNRFAQNLVSQLNSAHNPYGNLLAMSGLLADANRYRFSSKEWNPNAGLYYYLYRFYDSNLQRWPNRDPLGDVGFGIFQPRRQRLFGGPSLYTFVGNEPVTHTDALGLLRLGYACPTLTGEGITLFVCQLNVPIKFSQCVNADKVLDCITVAINVMNLGCATGDAAWFDEGCALAYSCFAAN